MPFNPNDELTMTFTVSEWNQVIGQLQEGPYKITAPLINKINMQAAKHEQEAAAAQRVQAGDIAYTNGELQPEARSLDPLAIKPN